MTMDGGHRLHTKGFQQSLDNHTQLFIPDISLGMSISIKYLLHSLLTLL